MAAVLIAYDLNKLGQRYTPLRDLIKKTFPIYWACLDSTFIVITPLMPIAVHNLIKAPLDANDEMVVLLLDPATWSTQGLSKNCLEWLRNNV